MGTKGRDACLWAFFLLFLSSVFLRGAAHYAALIGMLCLTAMYMDYCIRYLPGARRMSRGMGLRIAVLLPLHTVWARLLFRRGLKAGFTGAYEVHLSGERHALGDYLKLFASDLEIAQRTFPGTVFMWESSAPLPLFVRRLIRQNSIEGKAFLEDGGWWVPSFPFTERDLRKGRLRRGAIIV